MKMLGMNKKLRLAVLTLGIGLAVGFGAVSAADNNETSTLTGDVVEYNTQSGVITATGNVVMTKGDAVMRGAKAVYNSKTQHGQVTGGVVADKGDMHMTCAVFTADGQNHLVATGDVHGVKADKTFAGPLAEYFTDQDYVRMVQGGTITTADGTFTADYMEGWLKEDHFKGIGNAHIVSPPRSFEGGGDQAEYFGKDSGKAILTGNAWAIQENNTLKSQVLTVYLADNGNGQAKEE